MKLTHATALLAFLIHSSSFGQANLTDCLGYLSAERLFERRSGEAPDHQEIETALTMLPPLNRNIDGDPWQRYISASDKLVWAQERQDFLRGEDAKEQLF